MTTAPFFILGNPRSGTTLFRLMLTSHPEIHVPPECSFVVWLYPRYRNWSQSNGLNEFDRDQIVDDLVHCRKFDNWGLSVKEIHAAITAQQPANYAELCRLIYTMHAVQHAKMATLYGDKNNSYISHVTELLAIYPKAKLLHIVRDGRDVACSYRAVMQANYSSAYKPTLSVELAEIAEEWRINVLRLATDLAKVGEAQTLCVRYEDLLTAPVDTLGKVCEFLGVKYRSEMLQFHVFNASQHLEPTEMLQWKSKTLEPIDPTMIGKYKFDLTPAEIHQFNEIAKDALQYYGYSLLSARYYKT